MNQPKAALLGIVVMMISLFAAACGGQQSDLKVYLGYADTASTHARTGGFPSPWQGDPAVNFIGNGPQYDSGAIRIENPRDDAVTVDRVTVDVGPKHYDLWGTKLKVPARGNLILTQTGLGEGNPPEPNFDTSENTNPGQDAPYTPVVHVTVGGKTTDIKDTARILTTGGKDVGNLPDQPNESHSWVYQTAVDAGSSSSGPLDWGAIGLAALVPLFAFLPALLGALILLLIGWWLARLVARVVEALLVRLGLGRAAEETGLLPLVADQRRRWTLPWVLAVLAGAFVFLFFAISAADALHVPAISAYLNQVVLFIPKLAVALFILFVGVLLARWAAMLARGLAGEVGLRSPNLLAGAVRVLVVVFFAVMAADQLNIAKAIVDGFFVAFCVALALALGLAFGLGGERSAREIIRNAYSRRQVG